MAKKQEHKTGAKASKKEPPAAADASCKCQSAGTPENVDELTSQLEKLQDDLLRLAAEFDNYKKRITEEHKRDLAYAKQDLLTELVGITDVFDKAVKMQPANKEVETFLVGFAMLNDQFQALLKAEGVEKIAALGEQFDPDLHHAFEVGYDPEKKEGEIIAEIQTGYKYKERILRSSLVKVNQAPKKIVIDRGRESDQEEKEGMKNE